MPQPPVASEFYEPDLRDKLGARPLHLAHSLSCDTGAPTRFFVVRQVGERAVIDPKGLELAHAEADEALKALTTKYADTDAYFVAMNYAYRDDHDLALQWLERAYLQKDGGFVEIVGEPLFRNLANDPRYKAFLRKMNLPQ